MNQLLTLLAPRWLGGGFLLLALVVGVWLLLLHRRRGAWSLPWLVVAVGLLLAAGGVLFVPPWLGLILALCGLGVLLAKLLWVIVAGQWWPPLALLALVAVVIGMAGWGGIATGEVLYDVGLILLQVEAVQPAWLLLLLLIPVVIWMSFRSLAGLGTFRRYAAISLRCSLVLFLTLALAEVRLRQANEHVTTLFVVDRSLSVPQEPDENAPRIEGKNPPDLRWERIKKFINMAVEQRGDAHKRDLAGMIVFGRRPRLELPPSDVPRFNFTETASNIDAHYTDIAAAIKLALASFPEGTSKRIVLISDGNENLGNAEEQARIAKQNQVQIDVLPLGKGQRNEHEVLVQSVEAPPLTEQGSRFPIRVLIRSYNPHPVRGTLTLEQVVEGRREHVAPSPWGDVVLRPGLNSISFPPPKERPKGSYTYEAKFKPEWVVLPDGRSEKAPLGRIQNKQASTHVLALGQRRILFVEGLKDGKEDKLEHDFLVERLRELGDKDSRKFRIDHVRSDQLPKEQANLGVFLSNYDCVVLANAPADDFTDDQQEMIRSNTYDQGCGLIMIGGPDSFGAGGWQNTAVEKALPVDCEIKSLKVQGKGGLVLIMHACEMGDGNIWEKKIAKLAIDKLGPMDMIGITGLGWQGMEWHVPFQTVEGKREQMKRQIDKMTPMDMPEFDTGLKMAHEKLTDPKNDLAKKHVIIISDGDPQLANQAFLAKMKADKVTVTTVGVATHGAPSDQNMNNIAVSTGGRYHNVKNPNALPQIYTKETRLISQSFIYEKRFLPKLIISEGPTAKLPENLEALYGFVRTTPKQSPLVQMSILGPPQGEQDFPVLAQWHYGLGKAAAFTSDARSGLDRVAWDRDWAGARWYTGFWEQMLDYAVRSVETGRLTLNTEYRDGKVKVIIDARDRDNRPLTDLTLRGGITPPGQRLDDARKYELKFEQKNSGQYEAEFKADEAGSYFLNAQAKRLVKQKKDGKEVEVEETDSVRTGVTIPYSPEFADMESNVDLLERLRAATGGMTIEEDPNALNSIARSGTLFRPGEPTSRSMQPIWFWLVFATGVLLFFDVAVRRIAVEPAEIYAAGEKYWQRLRGTLVVAAATPQFLDRLKTKKAEIGESLEKKAQTRFEPTGTAPLPPPPGADIGVPQKPSTTPRPVTPKASEPSAEAGDFASRLMRAKRKAMEDRDKKQE